jgi:hypothetical protein
LGNRARPEDPEPLVQRDVTKQVAFLKSQWFFRKCPKDCL